MCREGAVPPQQLSAIVENGDRFADGVEGALPFTLRLEDVLVEQAILGRDMATLERPRE
jgi:hypothetical protein